ncbi:aldehyde dehydrogenase family 2 member C4-like isoform X3 [Punica granatum]|uniref:Aldehyde dehydrogenase 1 n=1 Tax=Punica granatum TaxID=22663 RepID=A0A6P8D6D3_PUNGR|nr:aldehyde dehydrogenase family 2 member C4-like isoform X3 [Punica granatum]
MANLEQNNTSADQSHFKIPDIKFTKLFINGEFVDSIKGRTFDTVDPRTGEVIVRIAEGDKEDVDAAVKAAREAFDHGPWPRMSGFQRARIMLKFADLIEQNIEELAALDCIDAGKLFLWGKLVDIPFGARLLQYYAGAADKVHGEVLKSSRPLHAYTLKEPIGVVGHIIPWNFPTSNFFMKVAPALAAGCTMIVKPAEQTPLSALFHAHLAKQAGVPDGVLNVVTGFGHTAGAAVSSHMDIDMVSFTGSTEVGRLIMQAAATSNLKMVSLELGGKSPLIIFDDADVDKAAELALNGILFNKGEVCAASSRVYVQEGIYGEFEKKLIEKAKAWKLGDPFDPETRQGPQVDKKQFERILSYIDIGVKEGGTLLTGGKPWGSKGYYVEPTVFVDVKEDMQIARDEIFGPVLSLMKFKCTPKIRSCLRSVTCRTVEEAIERANNSKYGLAAGVLTKDMNVANRVSRSIRAGIIWINCYSSLDVGFPFGGYKMSGFGRELGLDGLHKYLQVKTVMTPLHDSPWL